MEYVVRELREEDLHESTGYFTTLSNLSVIYPAPFAKTAAAFRAMLAQGTRVFVAVMPDGQIVGTCSLLVEHKLNRGGTVCGHIEDVATRKGFEGKGIGRAVMSAAIAYARSAHCYKIILDCSEHNKPFYEKLGFKQHEIEMRLDLQ